MRTLENIQKECQRLNPTYANIIRKKEIFPQHQKTGKTLEQTKKQSFSMFCF